VHQIHHKHGNRKCCEGNDGAADELGFEQRESTMIEKTCKRGGVIGGDWASGSVLAGGKKSERERAPNTAKAVDRNRTNGIVDAQPFEQFHTHHDHYSGNSSEKDSSGWTDPIARTSNGNQPGEEPVDSESDVPLLTKAVGIQHCS